MFFRGKTSGLSGKLPVRRTVEIEPRRIIRVGRNEPCPCGSGKKYKHCHESEGEAFLVKLAREQELARRIAEEKNLPWYKRLVLRLSR
ncbi:MAG: hypothetical protein Kow00109_22590 [Acidobacteriota bacterium]